MWWQWGFVIFLMVAAVAGSYEIVRAFGRAKMNAVFAPIAVGTPLMLGLSYWSAQGDGQFADQLPGAGQLQGVAVILSDDESLPPSERMPESERREFLADIADSSRQMLGIIESLLETDSLESGRLRIELSSHPLGGLVDRAWRGLARTAEAKRITASIGSPSAIASA